MGLLSSLFGGSSQSSSSTSRSQMQDFGQGIASFQAPALQNLFGQATDLLGQQQGQIGPAAQQLSQGLGAQGQGFISGLQQAGQGVSPFLGQGPVQQQIQGLGGALSALTNRQADIGLNQIQNRFGQAGSIGSRANLAGGSLLGDLNIGLQSAFGQGVSNILGADAQRQTGAAIAQGGLQNQAAGIGLGSLGSLFDLGISPFAAGFQPLQQAAQIIGPPTVLDQGARSFSTASGTSSGSQSGGLFGGLGSGGLGGLFGGIGAFLGN
jgi:hypothetical protein